MGYPVITSRNNDKIKEFNKFSASKSARRVHRRFTLEGLRLCADAVQSGFAPDSIFLTESALEKGGDRVKILLQSGAAVFLITDAVAQKMTDTVTPQGVFALLQMPAQTACAVQPGGKYVALDAVQNPQNLGAIARTAEAFGVDALFVGGGCDRFSPKALRASMGSLLRLPVYETEDLPQTVREIGQTVPTYATVPDANALNLCTVDFSKGALLLIGNEGNGLSEPVLNAATQRVTIPMRGHAESLNAAAAATVSIWEMMK